MTKLKILLATYLAICAVFVSLARDEILCQGGYDSAFVFCSPKH